MPLYFFDIRNGKGLIPDEEGTQLADLQGAQREAVISLDHAVGAAPHRITIEVRNEHWRPVLEATLTLEVRQLSH